MSKITICARCRHITAGNTELYPKCAIAPRTNYVTGAPGLRHCEAKNNGNCADYKPMPTGHDPQAHEAWGKATGSEHTVVMKMTKEDMAQFAKADEIRGKDSDDSE